MLSRKADLEFEKAQKERDFKKKIEEEKEKAPMKVVDESKFNHIK